MQENTEAFRIIRDWSELGYAPANIRRTEQVAEMLVNEVMATDGYLSFSGLNAAVKKLGTQILLSESEVKEAADKAAIEHAKKMDAKMRADYFESLKPQQRFQETKPAVENLEAKKIQNVVSEIVTAINTHSVNRHNGRDYSATEYEQGEIRASIAKHVTVTKVKDAADIITYKFKSLSEAQAALATVQAVKRSFKR
jgi:hypothetical protein